MRHYLHCLTIICYIFFISFSLIMNVGSKDNYDQPCSSCHSDIVSSQSTHFIDSDDDCLFCHGTSGDGNHDVEVYSSNNLCLSCHSDKDSGARHDQHDYLACVECHNPHGSSQQFNLVENSLTLCSSSCHDNNDIGLSHPVGDNIQDTHAGGELTCISSCHSLHKPQEEKLLQLTSLDLCNKCHSDKF